MHYDLLYENYEFVSLLLEQSDKINGFGFARKYSISIILCYTSILVKNIASYALTTIQTNSDSSRELNRNV